MQRQAAKLLVFAKAPVPYAAKTRLIPALGAERAAALHARLAEQTLETACSLPHTDVELWCTPDCSHPFFIDLQQRFYVELREQQGADLGARMHHALAHALAAGERAVLIGTDCPDLDQAFLKEAFAALNTADAVLGPALDGGYILIGVRHCAASLFEGIPWGTARVLELTRARLDTLGWRRVELPALRDLDRPEDLRYFPELDLSAVPLKG